MIGKQNSKLEETHSNNPDEMIETFVNVEIYNELVKKKKKFLIRSIIFFVCFYFALELGIILAPKIMAKQIFYHFNLTNEISTKSPLAEHFFLPGHLFDNPLEALSLNLTLILGTAGLPHILIRFFTVKDKQAVRSSVLTSSWLIGIFYLMTLILGFGVVVLVGVDHVVATDPSGNLAAPLLAYKVGGEFLTAFISAVAFATILAVVTGLVVASTTSFAYDIYNHILQKGKASEQDQLRMAKIAAIAVGVIAIILSLNLKNMNVTFLVSLTFSVAASINLPLILFTLYWKRFNVTGAIAGMVTGFVVSLICVSLGPIVMDPTHGLIHYKALFPLENPGIISIPFGFLGAALGTIFSKTPSDEKAFRSVQIRAHTGLHID